MNRFNKDFSFFTFLLLFASVMCDCELDWIQDCDNLRISIILYFLGKYFHGSCSLSCACGPSFDISPASDISVQATGIYFTLKFYTKMTGFWIVLLALIKNAFWKHQFKVIPGNTWSGTHIYQWVRKDKFLLSSQYLIEILNRKQIVQKWKIKNKNYNQ